MMAFQLTKPQPLLWGVGGVILWLIFFSAGALINSRAYREVLDPPELRRGSDPSTRPTTKPLEFGTVVRNIVPAAILYTPTNAAILCALAGLIGGCASNVVIAREQLKRIDAEDPGHDDGGGRRDPAYASDLLRRRLAYMSESPFISMLRGFVVYLAFMAGILVVVDDPFKDPTGATYLRYVGTVSLIAFTVGYDPTRFEELVKRIPTITPSGAPGPAKTDATPTTQTVASVSESRTAVVTQTVTEPKRR
jgi:hypothetical protein